MVVSTRQHTDLARFSGPAPSAHAALADGVVAAMRASRGDKSVVS